MGIETQPAHLRMSSHMHVFETIVFHIGLPKTGSTAIQAHLASQTAVLERHGWCYFGGEIFGQDVGINATVLMWTLSGGRGANKLPGHEDNEPRLVETFHRWARQQKAKRLLISAENLAGFDESRWRLILAAIAPYRAQKTAIRILCNLVPVVCRPVRGLPMCIRSSAVRRCPSEWAGVWFSALARFVGRRS